MREIRLSNDISVYNAAYHSMLCVIDELEKAIRHYDFNLEKYTIDGKRLYEESQREHVTDIRRLKAAALLSIRQAQRAIRSMR